MTNHEEQITKIMKLDLKLFTAAITIANTEPAAAANNINKKVIFKNCAVFTSCISRMNNAQVDDTQYIDRVRPMYNSIEHSDNIQKHLGFYGNIKEMNRL